MSTLTYTQEAENLKRLLAGVKNKGAFARQWKVPGGASMLSQHQSGHRPISLDAALAYAKGLGVSLEEISPRLAKKVSGLNNLEENQQGIKIVSLTEALELVANALQQADDLTLAQVRPLLAFLVDTPKRAPEIIPRLRALLGNDTPT